MRNPQAVELTGFLLRNPGARTRAQIVERWSLAALRSAIRGGAVTAILPGVFTATLYRDSVITRAHAAAAWCGPEAVVTGAVALHAWGLLDEPPAIVRVRVPFGRKREAPSWLKISRTSTPAPSGQWFDCPVELPAWAIVRGFGDLPLDVARDIVYRAVREGEVTVDQVHGVLAQLPRVRGRRALVSVLNACAAGCESHLETIGLRTVVNTSEFSHFLRQQRVRIGGRQYRLDMFDPRTLTAIELDGEVVHGRSVRRQKDVTRDAVLASVGILTLRFTYQDIVNRPEWVRATVRAVIAQREGVSRRVA